MFWKNSIALLGLLASLGSAKPGPGMVDPSDEDEAAGRDIYYRTDARGSATIAGKGFTSWAKTKNLPPNLSLWDHCKEKDGKHKYGNLENDGFIGMSTDIQVNLEWVTKYVDDVGAGESASQDSTTSIYMIAQDRNILACHDILKKHSPIAAESEYVVIGHVPWEQVIGWYDTFKVRGGQVTEAKWHENPDFTASAYTNKPMGTDVSQGADPMDFLPLAGWPKGDKRWKEHPWSTVNPANCGSKKRSLFDDFAGADMLATGGNDTDLVTGPSEETQLLPRGRGGSRSRSRKSSSTRRPAKKTSKKTSKKTATKKKTTGKKKTTCSAAIKKKNGGVCPKKTKTTCSAAIKKKNGGVCPKKTTCSAAIKKKNGGVCPAKCSAAIKKKNGGVCPPTCSAAIKKKNGGVCPPTCTAAEKKENGGVCPTCTAAEKKQNGGKCPPKSCPLPKTNGQLGEEYMRKYKAGLLGKGKKGKKTKTGGKKKGL